MYTSNNQSKTSKFDYHVPENHRIELKIQNHSRANTGIGNYSRRAMSPTGHIMQRNMFEGTL